MKYLFRALTLLGILVLTPQALGAQNTQSYSFHMPRIFNREIAAKQISHIPYEESKKPNFSLRVNSDPNELELLIREAPPIVETFYDVLTDDKPIPINKRFEIDSSAGNGFLKKVLGFFRNE
jgi:hypothetical protein